MSSSSVVGLRAGLQPLWFIAPLAAMTYPLPLIAFHSAIEAARAAGGGLALAAAALSLAAAFAAPAIALVCATRLLRIESPSDAELRARRIALLAVAAPPIFTAVGDDIYMLGNPVPDVAALAAFWAAMIAIIAAGGREAPPQSVPRSAPAWLRAAHGAVASMLLVFVAAHLSNHLAGLVGPDAHRSLMKTLRHIYRAPVVEPILVAGFLFMVGSGGWLAWIHSARRADGFRAFQLASGAFLLVFVTNHFNGVILLARIHLGIDSDWSFASGAPHGLIEDAWNIRLVPDYTLAVFFALAHPFAGLRVVLQSHGLRKGLADGVAVWGAALAGLLAIGIVLGLCGLRLRFEQEQGSGVSKPAFLAPSSGTGSTPRAVPRDRPFAPLAPFG
ncbi:hypothetical protein [Methylosinus sp. Sm6]|uniref:hypothetical protein n=1 Tax=Methylosinus sp. Sm6 TaxID=2866948 RepID=UPI001C99211C|nr:hypothetical protein [Methylosinus sp. Sm6]MBY6242281.1 hypothetical protein [Methylosinus sp. Sm6]